MDDYLLDELVRGMAALRASQAAILERIDSLSRLIDDAKAGRSPTARRSPSLRVDRATFSVLWDGKSCFLGNTLPFRVVERLARRPDHYVPVEELRDELWGATRAASTLRSAVFDLRKKLAGAGMTDLARMIDGSSQGHYAILLAKR